MANGYEGFSEDTIHLLEDRETTLTEFKESPINDANLYFVAFANGEGGTLFLGVTDAREVKGIDEDDEKLRRSLQDRADKCRPSIPIFIKEEINLSGKRVYRIDIPEGVDKPYCTEGGTYKIRLDGNNKGLHPDELRRTILHRSGLPARIRQLEHELAVKDRQLSEALSKSGMTKQQISRMVVDTLRGF